MRPPGHLAPRNIKAVEDGVEPPCRDSSRYKKRLSFSGQPDYTVSVSLSAPARQAGASANFATLQFVTNLDDNCDILKLNVTILVQICNNALL